MSETSDLLQASRQAHQHANTCLRTGDPEGAREGFREALTARQKAGATDPARLDASWRSDALHPAVSGEASRRHHRVPGQTVDQVAAAQDVALVRYYQEQLGEIDREALTVEHPEIVTPKQWQATTPGTIGACAEGHRMQLLSFDTRVCQACGLGEQLVETLALEDTEAFQTVRQERENREARAKAPARDA